MRTPLLAPLLALLCSCSAFVTAEQDVALAYDAEQDLLTITIDSRGVHPSSTGGEVVIGERRKEEDVVAGAVERVRAAADGAFYFVLLDLPIALDLTKAQAALADGPEPSEPLEEMWLEVLEGISVDASGIYLDELDEVGLYQRVRVARAQGLVDFLNALIRRGLLEDEVPADASARERAAAGARLAYAESGEPWIVLGPEALEVRMPMASWELADLMRGIAELPFEGQEGEMAPWEREFGPAAGRALFAGLGELRVDDGVVCFLYPFGEDGRILLPYARSRAPEQAGQLREALGEDGLERLSRDEVAARLGIGAR